MLRGWVRDTLVERDGRTAWRSGWRRNRVLDGGLDLVGELLAREPGAAGLSVLAVGTGDPGWGDDPPAPDPADEALVAELLRVRLEPGKHVRVAADGTLRVNVTVKFEADAELRELGLLGAGASPRPGTGRVFNCVRHPALKVAAGASLRREL